MALRIFQFGIVFAIGFQLGPAFSFAGAQDNTEVDVSLLLKDPKDVIVSKGGQSATLQCDAKSTNTLEIEWLHNNKIIPRNDTRRQFQKNGTLLYIPKVGNGKKSLGGEYRCLVKNRYGAILSSPAQLKVASIDRDFSTQPANLTVEEFQPAVLFCNIHSVPSAQIRWEYNHSIIILPHLRYVPLPSGALLITKTHSSDAGFYRCTATNNLLKKTKHSKIVQLTVVSKPERIQEPTFLPLDIPLNNTILVGDDLTLSCAVRGWPIPTIQWLNNLSIVISNSSILHIKNIKLRDDGNYTCVAYNSGGRIFQKYMVNVMEKPYFNVTPVSMAYPSAKTVRLDCQAKGVPQPEIKWFKNGQPLVYGVRIKKIWTGLVFSHTFTYDAGIYQCIAENAAGRVWAATRMVLASPQSPSPPENVQCRPFNDTSICLQWKQPDNVSVQAYSIYSFYSSAAGSEISGPEYVTNMTYHLASGLDRSTNYTFYVRLYSIVASDQSNTVVCKTGTKGTRNLKVRALNETSVELTWSEMSTDVHCDGTKGYTVQWKLFGGRLIHADSTSQFHYIISDLKAADYVFRVISANYKYDNSTWKLFSLKHSNNSNNNNINNINNMNNKYNNNNNNIDKLDSDSPFSITNTSELPLAPVIIDAIAISARIINISWSDVSDTKYYTICYFDIKIQDVCKETNLIQSSTNMLQVDRLQPNTQYEFRIRAHFSDTEFTPYSQPVRVNTTADVPSPVLNLKYDVVNESSACLHWLPPLHKNGKIFKYTIFYTPDRNWPLEKWLKKTVDNSPKKHKGCRPGDEHHISTLLNNLDSIKQYTVLVGAVSDVGLGNLTVPIPLSTGSIKSYPNGDGYATEKPDTIINNQKLGIIMGTTIAISCILVCISCILVRKRCLKRGMNQRGVRTAGSSSNYYPAIAHYATEGSSVQVRLQDPCAAEIHEIEHLVGDDTSGQIPAVTPIHLDTKSGAGFPNGHINGSVKPYVNGFLTNGSVHITENPQYYARDCNGYIGGKKNKNCETIPLSTPHHYEEDSNSNLKTSKFQDLQRLFENSKLEQQQQQNKNIIDDKSDSMKTGKLVNNHQCNPHFNNINNRDKSDSSSFNSSRHSFSEDDDTLNTTQLTCLDNSVISHRRLSPLLGPNG